MAIQVGSNFDYKGQLPNFDRDSFDTISEMVNYPEECLDDGHISYCKETESHYVYKESNTDDDLLKKWRKMTTDGKADLSGLGTVATTNNYNDLDNIPTLPKPDNKSITVNDSGEWEAAGLAPHVGDNGNWFVGDTDTGVPTQDTTGRIRLNSTGALKYLSEMIDAGTIEIVNGNTLKVISLDGLKTTIAELNFIRGLDRNIMNFINSLSGAMSLKGQVANDAALQRISNPGNGDTYIVKKSESNDDKTATFAYSAKDSDWICLGVTEIEIRDFSTNPIDLESEVTGVLQKEHIAGYHNHTNLSTIEKFSEVNGEIYYDNKPIGSGSSSGSSSDSGSGTKNYMALDNKPAINGVTLSGDKSTFDLGLDINLLSKKDYCDPLDTEYVKKAKTATGLECMDKAKNPYMYYGTNKDNVIGVHILPINSSDKSAIEQRIFNNVTVGDSLSIESETDLNDKVIINVFKEIEGESGVSETIKEFNQKTEPSFISSPSVMFNKDNCSLSGNKVITAKYNEDENYYEYDLSNYITLVGGSEII